MARSAVSDKCWNNKTDAVKGSLSTVLALQKFCQQWMGDLESCLNIPFCVWAWLHD